VTSPEPVPCDGFRLPSTQRSGEYRLAYYGWHSTLTVRVGHAHHDPRSSRPCCGRPVDPVAIDWDDVSAPSRRNRFFLPTVIWSARTSRVLGRILGQMYFCCVRHVRLSCVTSIRPANPFCCSVLGGACIDADVAAYASQTDPTSRSFLSLRAPRTVDLTQRSSPQCQAVSACRCSMAAGRVCPAPVDVGHQVAAFAVGRDKLEYPRVLLVLNVESGLVRAATARVRTGCPDFAEDVVEKVGVQQRFVMRARSRGFRALDYAWS